MTTTPEAPERPRRPAAEVNEEIRALWLSTGGYLRPEQHLEYEKLVAEWAEATASTATHPQAV